MIEPDKRTAIYQMHQAGMSVREISERMGVSRGTVKAVIARQGQMPAIARKDRIHVDPDLLRKLYKECGGWKQRIHERLVEEEKIAISYPTLTRLLRKLGMGQQQHVRCDSVPDEPGLEMQHDTTVYKVTLGGQRTKPHASSSGRQGGTDSGQGRRTRTGLPHEVACRTSVTLLFARARHRSIRLRSVPGKLLLGAGDEA
jgi:transposase